MFRRNEAHRKEDEIGSKLEGAARNFLEISVEPRADDCFYSATLTPQFLGHNRKLPLRTFFLGGRGAHLQGAVRPNQRLVFLIRGARHDFELGHGKRALADYGPDAIRARVAAADHDDMEG